MYKIFLSKLMPDRRQNWLDKPNWAIEIDGKIYYGALSEKQLEWAMQEREVKPFFKEVY